MDEVKVMYTLCLVTSIHVYFILMKYDQHLLTYCCISILSLHKLTTHTAVADVLWQNQLLLSVVISIIPKITSRVPKSQRSWTIWANFFTFLLLWDHNWDIECDLGWEQADKLRDFCQWAGWEDRGMEVLMCNPSNQRCRLSTFKNNRTSSTATETYQWLERGICSRRKVLKWNLQRPSLRKH